MKNLKDGIRSVYFQVINYVQSMNALLYFTVWIVLFSVGIMSLVMFFKKHDGTQTSFSSSSKLFISILFFVLLIVWTLMRK